MGEERIGTCWELKVFISGSGGEGGRAHALVAEGCGQGGHGHALGLPSGGMGGGGGVGTLMAWWEVRVLLAREWW